MERYKVIIEKYKPDEILALVQKGFEKTGVLPLIGPGKTVLIKPNFVTDVQEYIDKGANTDVRLIEAVVKILLQKHAKVYLCESETGTFVKGRNFERVIKMMGIDKLAERLGFDIVNLTSAKKRKVKIENGLYLKEIDLPEIALDCDLIVNMPKIKTHEYTNMTCSLKNMFGIIPDPIRIKYYCELHKVISDVNSIFNKKMFIVVDGIIGMEGNGPLFGIPVDLNLLIFGVEPGLVDLSVGKIIGIERREIKHLTHYLSNVSKLSYTDLQFPSLFPDEVYRPFKKATQNLFVRLEGEFVRHPVILKLTYNPWIQRHLLYPLRYIFNYFRGGSYSWYIEK